MHHRSAVVQKEAPNDTTETRGGKWLSCLVRRHHDNRTAHHSPSPSRCPGVISQSGAESRRRDSSNLFAWASGNRAFGFRGVSLHRPIVRADVRPWGRALVAECWRVASGRHFARLAVDLISGRVRQKSGFCGADLCIARSAQIRVLAESAMCAFVAAWKLRHIAFDVLIALL
jgi:hypothetical protein